jgi:hypothetical protein
MTKFEQMINDGKFSKHTINVIINDFKNDDTFDATINAKTLNEIDSKLPEGYEMDRLTTLQNYFNPETIDKYEIELMNSQYIYFEQFYRIIEYGFYNYVTALKNDDMATINRLDRKFQK